MPAATLAAPTDAPTAPANIIADTQQALQLSPIAEASIDGIQGIMDRLAVAGMHIANVVPLAETAALAAGPQSDADPPASREALVIQEEADLLSSLRSSRFADHLGYIAGAASTIDRIQEAVQRQMVGPFRDACHRIDAAHEAQSPAEPGREGQPATATAGPAATEAMQTAQVMYVVQPIALLALAVAFLVS